MEHDAKHLIVMLKAPRPGLVKTRLAAALGREGACRAYRLLVEHLLAKLASYTQVTLRFAPDDALQEIRPWLGQGWQAMPQGPGDLGQRMERAFAHRFSSQDRVNVVMIGVDCPEVCPEDIETAWRKLETHDVVLGPAEDGGYWLIGLRAPMPQLFQKIDWSTDRVLSQTKDIAEEEGLAVAELRTLWDVDELSQWQLFEKPGGRTMHLE